DDVADAREPVAEDVGADDRVAADDAQIADDPPTLHGVGRHDQHGIPPRSVSSPPAPRAAVPVACRQCPVGAIEERCCRRNAPPEPLLRRCVPGRYGGQAAARASEAIAACTPPCPCGTPARPSAISTAPSAPSSIGSFRSPIWPIRNSRPFSLPRPPPRLTLK